MHPAGVLHSLTQGLEPTAYILPVPHEDDPPQAYQVVQLYIGEIYILRCAFTCRLLLREAGAGLELVWAWLAQRRLEVRRPKACMLAPTSVQVKLHMRRYV